MQRPLGQAKKGVGHFALLLPEQQKESGNEISRPLMLYTVRQKAFIPEL